MPVRKGFSLVELLAALALASVLMLAVMQVTASLGRMDSAMERRGDTGVWRADVHELVRSDLEQAMFAVAETPGELHLEGMIGLGDGRGTPVLVVYRLIRKVAGVARVAGAEDEPGLLVREQRRLLDRGGSVRRDLVAADVIGFEPEMLDPGERPQPIPREIGQPPRPRLGRLSLTVAGETPLVIEQERP